MSAEALGEVPAGMASESGLAGLLEDDDWDDAAPMLGAACRDLCQ